MNKTTKEAYMMNIELPKSSDECTQKCLFEKAFKEKLEQTKTVLNIVFPTKLNYVGTAINYIVNEHMDEMRRDYVSSIISTENYKKTLDIIVNSIMHFINNDIELHMFFSNGIHIEIPQDYIANFKVAIVFSFNRIGNDMQVKIALKGTTYSEFRMNDWEVVKEHVASNIKHHPEVWKLQHVNTFEEAIEKIEELVQPLWPLLRVATKYLYKNE